MPPIVAAGSITSILENKLDDTTIDTNTVIIPDMTQEYIPTYLSGWANNLFFYSEGFRRLPLWIDDLTFGLRADIYDEMLKDAQVKSCLGILVGGILAGGINIIPFSEPGGTANTEDVAAAHFCSDVLNRLETPLITSVLPDMLTAIGVGNRIAELVYWDMLDTPIPGKLTLKAIKVKARNSVAFVCDRYLNVIGIAAVQTPGVMELNVEAIFSTEKFTWLSWRPVNSDPRGSSDFRAAYAPWWGKQSLIPEYMKYLVRFASGSIIGKTAQNAQKVPLVDSFGNKITNPDGTPTMLDPAGLMLAALEAIRNGAAGVFPFGSEIDVLKSDGNGEAFQIAFNWFDMQMAKSILYQTLATEQGNGSKGGAQVHQDALSISFEMGKMVTEQLLYRICHLMVKYNFSNANTPIVKLPGVEQQDFLAKCSAVAKLQQVGYLHPSQFEKLDGFIGLPARSQDAIAQAIKDWIYGPNASIRVQDRFDDTIGGPSGGGTGGGP